MAHQNEKLRGSMKNLLEYMVKVEPTHNIEEFTKQANEIKKLISNAEKVLEHNPSDKEMVMNAKRIINEVKTILAKDIKGMKRAIAKKTSKKTPKNTSKKASKKRSKRTSKRKGSKRR